MSASAARQPKLAPYIARAADDVVLLDLRRHGPRTAAEMVAALPMDPQVIVDRVAALVGRGVLRIEGDRFVIRGSAHE